MDFRGDINTCVLSCSSSFSIQGLQVKTSHGVRSGIQKIEVQLPIPAPLEIHYHAQCQREMGNYFACLGELSIRPTSEREGIGGASDNATYCYWAGGQSCL